MVVVKGGGETYQIGSGKVMDWEEVPAWFKDQLDMQKEEPQCSAQKHAAQQCIDAKGFWAPACEDLTELYHVCQGNALRRMLPLKGGAEPPSRPHS
jgi:hypothetical protein